MNYVFLALIGMILLGVVDFLLKKALTVGIHVNAISFSVYFGVAVLFGISCLSKKDSLKIRKSLLMYSTIVGVLVFLGTILALIALKTGNASVILPIARLGFVVTAICAFVFIHEKITFAKGLGIVCAVISLILLSW